MKFESLFGSVIVAVVTFTSCFAVFIGLSIKLIDYYYSSKLKNPAALYEIGEVIDNEYQVVATDSKNTLWLQQRNDNYTYIAVVSSDYPNLTFSERIKWLWNTSLRDSVSIEITDNVEGKESGNFE